MTPTSSQMDKPSSRFLWVGLLAGPVVWAVYFVAGYLLIEASCRTDILNFNVLGLSGLAVVVIVLTLVALAVTLYAGFVTYRAWQHFGAAAPEQDEQARAEDPGRFITFAGLVLSGLFAFVILLTGLPALFLQPCFF